MCAAHRLEEAQPEAKLEPLDAALAPRLHDGHADVGLDADERVAVHEAEAGRERGRGCEDGRDGLACERARGAAVSEAFRRAGEPRKTTKREWDAPEPTSLPALTHACPCRFSLLHHFLSAPLRHGVGTWNGVRTLAPSA